MQTKSCNMSLVSSTLLTSLSMNIYQPLLWHCWIWIWFNEFHVWKASLCWWNSRLNQRCEKYSHTLGQSTHTFSLQRVWRANIVSSRRCERFRSSVKQTSLSMSMELLSLFSNPSSKLEQCLVTLSVDNCCFNVTWSPKYLWTCSLI